MVLRKEEGKLESSYKTINNVNYDREVYGYSRNLLENKMNNQFTFVEEIKDEDHWIYYLYKKNN